MLKRLPARRGRGWPRRRARQVVGDFGDENDVGAAGDARAQGQPAGAVAHDLDDDDAMVAGGRGMEPVDGLGGDAQRRVEAKGDIGPRDVVVDGFGQGDDVQPGLFQPQGVLLRAAAADADRASRWWRLVRIEDRAGHVADLAADLPSGAACRGWCPGSCRRR